MSKQGDQNYLFSQLRNSHELYCDTILKRGGKISEFTTQRWQFYLMSSSAKRFGLRGGHQLLVLSTNN
jgi:hypothetical protein